MYLILMTRVALGSDFPYLGWVGSLEPVLGLGWVYPCIVLWFKSGTKQVKYVLLVANSAILITIRHIFIDLNQYLLRFIEI